VEKNNMSMIIRLFKLIIFRMTWRKKNKHNMTIPKRIFDSNVVNVGRYAYGPLNVFNYGAHNEQLIIGDFVSIASGVKFILGGNHNLHTFSTYPFKVKLMGQKTESTSKGSIIIGDDVWIGTDSIILSGVKVGQGAVVGAGSVVSKDIPPYAIVIGNPAKVVKFRFDQTLIDKMTHFQFSEVDNTFIEKKINLLYKDLNKELLDEIIKR
jgi:acetyltransferase-like isoleucine patch superfamily enzyme